MASFRPLLALSAAVLLTACAGNPAGDDPGPLRIDPISIESVEVLVQAGAPAQVSAHVKGVIGDGCATLLPVTQARSGNTVTVSILRSRPENAICIQIAKLYDEVIRL